MLSSFETAFGCSVLMCFLNREIASSYMILICLLYIRASPKSNGPYERRESVFASACLIIEAVISLSLKERIVGFVRARELYPIW